MSLRAQPDPLPAWRTIRAQLRECVGESTYEIWLAPLQLLAWDGEQLLLQAPAETKSWVADRFGRLIERCATEILGEGTRVCLDGATEHGKSSTAGPPHVPTGPATPSENFFIPRYTFEQFIIGPGNRLAHGAALAVAELPGQAYNPLFLHAPPGLGKTHLMQAIGNYLLAFGGGSRVRYATAETFTNDFMAALSTKSLPSFKRAYREADVLLIDDVQFFASKARTEEEFFHTFEALYTAGRQLVLTCDRLPSALSSLETRLRERFEAGLVADIAPPDHRTRVTILRKRAALDGLQVADPAVFDLIADRVTHNIRALEGALIRVVAYHSLTSRTIDLALATEVMDQMYPVRGSARPTITAIQEVVAGHYSLSIAELVSPGRTARIAWPRHLAIQLARDLTGKSVQQIGEAFGGRNHATVLHACKRVSERLRDEPRLRDELDAMAGEILQSQADRDY